MNANRVASLPGVQCYSSLRSTGYVRLRRVRNNSQFQRTDIYFWDLYSLVSVKVKYGIWMIETSRQNCRLQSAFLSRQNGPHALSVLVTAVGFANDGDYGVTVAERACLSSLSLIREPQSAAVFLSRKCVRRTVTASFRVRGKRWKTF